MQVRNAQEKNKGAGLVDLDKLGVPVVEVLDRSRQGG
jgi:hypothetical protein